MWASLVAQLVKSPPAMQETPVLFLGQEDPLEKGIATHSSILAWENSGQESHTTERLSLSLKKMKKQNLSTMPCDSMRFHVT